MTGHHRERLYLSFDVLTGKDGGEEIDASIDHACLRGCRPRRSRQRFGRKQVEEVVFEGAENWMGQLQTSARQQS